MGSVQHHLLKPTHTKLVQYLSDIDRKSDGKQSKSVLEFATSTVLLSFVLLFFDDVDIINT